VKKVKSKKGKKKGREKGGEIKNNNNNK